MGISRNRTRGGTIVTNLTYLSYGADGSPNGQGTTGSFVTRSDVEAISDVVTPGFQKVRSTGQIVMNPVSIAKDDISCTSETNLSVGPIPNWGEIKISGPLTADHTVSSVIPATVSTRVDDSKSWTLQEAYSKVAQEDFMALVTVAEANKTASMIASPLAASEALLRKVLSRKAALVRKGLSAIGAATTAWLEYRLGWKPLLYDIEGIFEAYTSNTQYYDRPTRLVARRSNTVDYREGPVTYSEAGTILGPLNMSRTYALKVKVSSGVLYELHETSLEIANARRMGLRLSDVPASLWELVPYSFVLDRYISVGSWLNAITPKPGVSIKGDWTTTVSESSQTQVRLPTSMVIAGYPFTLPGGSTDTYKYRRIGRVVNQGASAFAVPQWNPKTLTLNQTLDQFALFFNALSGIGIPRK